MEQTLRRCLRLLRFALTSGVINGALVTVPAGGIAHAQQAAVLRRRRTALRDHGSQSATATDDSDALPSSPRMKTVRRWALDVLSCMADAVPALLHRCRESTLCDRLSESTAPSTATLASAVRSSAVRSGHGSGEDAGYGMRECEPHGLAEALTSAAVDAVSMVLKTSDGIERKASRPR